jgi:hypothetical protein
MVKFIAKCGQPPAEKLPDLRKHSTPTTKTKQKKETLLKHGFNFKFYTSQYIAKQALYIIVMSTTKDVADA